MAERKNNNKKHDHPTRCDICGAPGLRTEFITDDYDGLVIQNIPEHHCDVCGESYVTYQTLAAIDEVRTHPERYPVPAVSVALALPS